MKSLEKSESNPVTVWQRLYVRVTSLAIVVASLTGCSTMTGSGAIDLDAVSEKPLICEEAWQPIYWSKSDTPETIVQAKSNNASWKSYCGGDNAS